MDYSSQAKIEFDRKLVRQRQSQEREKHVRRNILTFLDIVHLTLRPFC